LGGKAGGKESGHSVGKLITIETGPAKKLLGRGKKK